MRAEFAQAMIALFQKRRDLVFITGDLGYMALEGVAEAYAERFINAGIAEVVYDGAYALDGVARQLLEEAGVRVRQVESAAPATT